MRKKKYHQKKWGDLLRQKGPPQKIGEPDDYSRRRGVC